jgi:hypothetical protein
MQPRMMRAVPPGARASCTRRKRPHKIQSAQKSACANEASSNEPMASPIMSRVASACGSTFSSPKTSSSLSPPLALQTSGDGVAMGARPPPPPPPRARCASRRFRLRSSEQLWHSVLCGRRGPWPAPLEHVPHALCRSRMRRLASKHFWHTVFPGATLPCRTDLLHSPCCVRSWQRSFSRLKHAAQRASPSTGGPCVRPWKGASSAPLNPRGAWGCAASQAAVGGLGGR